MKIPSLLVGMQFVDKDGKLTQNGMNYLTLLATPLQQNLSDEGYKLPQQPTTTIANLNTTQSTGAILYNNDAHSFVGCVNGTFKTFTLT